MAKARLINKKRRLRIEAIATILFMVSLFMFAGAKFLLKSYNYELALTSQGIQSDADKLKEDVAALESDISELQNRDRVLGMAESDGIKTNQDNVVIIGDEE